MKMDRQNGSPPGRSVSGFHKLLPELWASNEKAGQDVSGLQTVNQYHPNSEEFPFSLLIAESSDGVSAKSSTARFSAIRSR